MLPTLVHRGFGRHQTCSCDRRPTHVSILPKYSARRRCASWGRAGDGSLMSYMLVQPGHVRGAHPTLHFTSKDPAGHQAPVQTRPSATSQVRAKKLDFDGEMAIPDTDTARAKRHVGRRD